MAGPSRLERALQAALADPQGALERLGRAKAERNLMQFVRMMWPVVEPSQPFVDGWAMGAVAEHLEAVTAGQITRLLINVPPGFSKSMLTSVFWPAWMWGPKNLPSTRFMCASYSQDLTVRDNQRCRRILESPDFRAAWGGRFKLSSEQNAKVKFENDRTGWKFATSVAGLGTGERGDVFIVDDPHSVKAVEYDATRAAALQWFSEVVPTRLNNASKSAIVVIMQRVHERDVSGLILSEKLAYDHLMIPMEFDSQHEFLSKTSLGWMDPRRTDGELAWPERFSKEYLETKLKPEMRAWGGSYAEAGQLQQLPVPRGGGMFREEDFKFVDAAPPGGRVVRGWDLAATDGTENKHAAWTVGARLRLAGGAVYLEHVVREQAGEKRVREMIRHAADHDPEDCEQSIPQDPGQAGKAQKSHLARALHGRRFHFSLESGSKEDRARPLADQSQSGNFFLVRGPWNEDFVKEAKLFPNGRYKDQIDAVSRAYARLVSFHEELTGAAPEVLEPEE
jgi:predicted phage terminase large subunit-like protein